MAHEKQELNTGSSVITLEKSSYGGGFELVVQEDFMHGGSGDLASSGSLGLYDLMKLRRLIDNAIELEVGY